MLAVYCNPSRRFRIDPVSPLISDNNCNGRESDQVAMAKELAGDRVAVSLHDLIIIVGLGKGISWFESNDMGTIRSYLIMYSISRTRRHVSNDPGTLASIFSSL